MTRVLPDNQAEITDNELIVMCKLGDRSSFSQLYQRYQSRVRSTLYQLCGSHMLDDLVQEVFLRVWQGLPKLRQTSFFSTWLYRITLNVATDGRRLFAKNRLNQGDANLEQLLSLKSENNDLIQLHYQDLVQKGLLSLSLEHRVVLVFHDLEDLSLKEIAKILQIPVGTVKSRLYYARSAMKKFLQQQGASL